MSNRTSFVAFVLVILGAVDLQGCTSAACPESCALGCRADGSCRACNDGCAPENTTACASGTLRTCVADAKGCLGWSEPAACADGFCADAATCGVCNHSCDLANATACASGELRTCAADINGCRAWSEPVACADGFCADGASCGRCNDACSTASAVGCAGGHVVTCVADANGCLSWLETSACPEGFCADATTCGVCDHTCDVEAATRCADGEVQTCVADANGCLAWTEPSACADGFCADATTCGVCNNGCEAEGATECAGGEVKTCVADADGCLAWSEPSVCPSGLCAVSASVCKIVPSSLQPKLTAGQWHTCALTGSGAVKCWGSAGYNLLGDGSSGPHPAPVAVLGLDGVAESATAVAAGASHVCAILDSGAMKCWGSDGHGQLGDGEAAESQPTPVPVEGIDGLTKSATAVTAGNYHTCAVLVGGAVECWGRGYDGQLGNDIA